MKYYDIVQRGNVRSTTTVASGPPFEVKVVTIPDRLVEQASREITETLYEMRRRRETQKYLPEEYGQEEELFVPEYVYSG